MHFKLSEKNDYLISFCTVQNYMNDINNISSDKLLITR
jgi:hypothetical protein